MFHELGHNTDDNYREGIELKTRLQDAALNKGRFYEWTNTVFERLGSGEKLYKKNNAMQLAPTGYGALTQLGSMLACSLGISEIEFAKIKDKGREYEKQYFETILPKAKGLQGADTLNRIMQIFDDYNIDSGFSLKQKIENQNLLNEFYAECIDIMKKRIDVDIQNGKAIDPENYKKNQEFLLHKLNYNYKSATISDGFRISRKQIVHDIGFCTDELSKQDLNNIAQNYVEMADFGFDNRTLGKYNRTITTTKEKSFFKSLEVRHLSKEKREEKVEESPDIARDEKEGKVEESPDFSRDER